jgi:hypothetical protein
VSVQKSLMRTLVAATTLAVSVNASSSNNNNFTIKGSIFEKVGRESKVDPLLLYSIAIVESATGVGKGNIKPEELVIRHDGGAVFFDTKEQAVNGLNKVLQSTSNVDVGLMQINLKYHPHNNPAELFNPESNLKFAANILKTAMDSTPDKIIGVGRYHQWADVALCEWYGKYVWQIHANLKKLEVISE